MKCLTVSLEIDLNARMPNNSQTTSDLPNLQLWIGRLQVKRQEKIHCGHESMVSFEG